MFVLRSALLFLIVGLLIYFGPRLLGRSTSSHGEPRLELWRHVFYGSLVFFLGAPMVIMLHEIGHWIVGSLVGFELILRHDSVFMPRQMIGEGHRQKMLLFTCGGPMVELTLASIGTWKLWSYRRMGKVLTHPFRFWIWTLFAACGLRWLRLQSDASSDESSISMLLNWPASTLSLMLILPALCVFGLIVDTHRRLGTGIVLLPALVAVAGSAMLWLYVLGPLVFRD